MKLSRLTIAVFAVAVSAAAVVLYVILGLTVHAVPRPPKTLAPLEAVEPPQKAPELSPVGESGARVKLAAFRGNFVLVNLWAPWCAPCVRELPALARLQRAMHSGVKVIAIDVGRDEERGARAFLTSHGAENLEVFLDPDRSVMRALQASGLPLSVLIDTHGREMARAVGAVEWDSPAAIAWLKQLAKQPRSSGR